LWETPDVASRSASLFKTLHFETTAKKLLLVIRSEQLSEEQGQVQPAPSEEEAARKEQGHVEVLQDEDPRQPS
jgi:hypothetical protein